MKIARQYTPHDSVVDLVREDYNILPLLSRFGIPLGFGNKTIEEVCEESGISSAFFLIVVNFTLSGSMPSPIPSDIDPRGIVNFLHNSHSYFQNYKIPHIRANMVNALDPSHSDINPIILKFFDDFVDEVNRHFAYEEATVFPYISSLLDGKPTRYSIDIFRRHHDEVAAKLSELKNLILRYYSTSRPDLIIPLLSPIRCCCQVQ